MLRTYINVTPRKRRVSRNCNFASYFTYNEVTPRKRRVSRNICKCLYENHVYVTPRKRRVSRNEKAGFNKVVAESHASQEACE